MQTEHPVAARRPDLDALRAIAMLLGIILHTALSFFTSYWMVSDSRKSEGFALLVSAIHGFRMPLFFVMSGFFSAMLLHRRGRAALIRHRFFRVLLPLMAGLFTIVPLTFTLSMIATVTAPRATPSRPAKAAKPTDLWSAAAAGDLAAIEGYLDRGDDVNRPDTAFSMTPLVHAAVAGKLEAVELLQRRGANLNTQARDGGTALHAAAFLGHVRVVDSLVKLGADVNVNNQRGESPLDVALVDEATTVFFASMLELEVEPKGLGQRKGEVAEILRQHGGKTGQKPGLALQLMEMPLFNHLWFLWFLWWLVVGLALVSALGSWLPLKLPAWLVVSPAHYAWLVPLTMIPQAFMGSEGSPIFGPDTSTGILPIPHVLAYYAVFFGFGALYYRNDDHTDHDRRFWGLELALALLVVLPLGLALMGGAWPGLDPAVRRPLFWFIQASYPWLMTFGLMGLFRRLFPDESPRMRYLSDSAYWLYLAHLPLVIAGQMLVRSWALPAVVKFTLIVVVVTAFLLGTYQTMVRYTWIGRFLNGARTRPTAAEPVVVTS